LDVSDHEKQEVEATLCGQIKEMSAQTDKLICEANQAKINWKKIEGALRGQIKDLRKRSPDDINRDYVEDTLSSQSKELKATIQKRGSAN
jgi:hypothetical protein